MKGPWIFTVGEGHYSLKRSMYFSYNATYHYKPTPSVIYVSWRPQSWLR